MPHFPKYTLSCDGPRRGWTLTEDATQRVVARFATKHRATRPGSLEDALGDEGGSVKVQTPDGDFEERRSFSRARIRGSREAVRTS